MTRTMRAALLDAPCDPAELAVTEVPVPETLPGEVVVRVQASVINRNDVLNVRGLPITVFPRVPGRDFAGIVVAGPDALVGRAVWGTGSGDLGFTRHGAHAELLTVPVGALGDQPEAERELLLRRFPGIVAVNGADGDLTEGTVDAAFDTVGNALFPQVMATLGMGARMAVIAGVPNAEVALDLSAYYRRALSLYGVNTTRYDSTWCARLLRALGPGFDDGSLPPIDIARTIDLTAAAEGYGAVWACAQRAELDDRVDWTSVKAILAGAGEHLVGQ